MPPADSPALLAQPKVLQKLMRHKSPLTTQKYINVASQLQTAAANLYVPPVLRAVNE